VGNRCGRPRANTSRAAVGRPPDRRTAGPQGPEFPAHASQLVEQSVVTNSTVISSRSNTDASSEATAARPSVYRPGAPAAVPQISGNRGVERGVRSLGRPVCGPRDVVGVAYQPVTARWGTAAPLGLPVEPGVHHARWAGPRAVPRDSPRHHRRRITIDAHHLGGLLRRPLRNALWVRISEAPLSSG
jgi:hypothetical protein